MNTTEFLSIATAICPDRTAIIFDAKRYTFTELSERVNKLADALSQLKVKKGDRVAILEVNCSEYVEAYFATAKIGGVFVPLNFRAREAEVAHMLNNAEPSVLFVGERYAEMANSMRSKLPSIKHYIVIGGKAPGMLTYDEFLAKGSPEEKTFADIGDDDDTVLMYTAGTTGLPKGVPQDHNSYSIYVLQNVEPPNPDVSETNLLTMPLYHVAGVQAMLSAIYGGRTIALMRQFETKEWFEIAQREKVTRAMLVPTMLKWIIDDLDFKKYDLSKLRVITYGAAACPFEVLKKAMELFPGRAFINAYGSTETASTIAALSPEDYIFTGKESEAVREKKLKRLSSSIGKPLGDVEVQIRDEGGKALPVRQIGEVVMRGPRVMKGYWKDEEKTAKAFTKDGWYRTGDTGYFDEEGYIYLTGRSDDLIKRGGEYISPEEVENVLYSHPKVEEAAVIGVSDLEWGQIPKAVVVLKKGVTATPEEIMEYCRAQLASYKRPRSVIFVNELPKTATGKILRRVLRDQYGKSA